MSKGVVVGVVVVGVVVLLGGAAYAMGAPKPVIRPDLYPPPPPPPPDSLGRYIVREGVAAGKEIYNEGKGAVQSVTGEDAASFAKKCAVNQLYCGYKVTVTTAKKIWNSIF